MKKRVSAIILAGVMLFSTSFAFAESAKQNKEEVQVKFSDITKHWSYEAVKDLLQKDAIPYSDDKFLPGKAIVKNEFAMMLCNAIGIKLNYLVAPDIKDYFDDVKADAPYASALIDLVTMGILDKGSFKPDSTLTREEMVHYVMKARRFMLGDNYPMINIKPASFADVDSITPEYSGEVARAQHYNLISGTGNNMFNPKKAATRAESVVVIDKMLKLVEQEKQIVTIKPDAFINKDSIDMSVIITNNTKKDVVFNHSSGKKFDFALLDADRKEIYRWSADKSFTMMLTSSTIKAGDMLTFSDTLSGDAFKAVKDKMVYFKAYVIGSSDSFNINPDGYEIKLK